MKEVALRLQSLSENEWQVLVRGFHEKIAALSDQDLAVLDEVPRTWDAVLAAMAPRSALRLDERAMCAIGGRLFQRLVNGNIATVLHREEAEARALGVPLRLVVQVLEGEKSELLRRVPFELLHEGTFWARRAGVHAVRRPDDADEGEVTFGAAPRAVIAWAASADRAEPTPAELRDHGERIRRALERAGFSVHIEEGCTPARLQAAIEAGCELLYVACHGSESYDSHGQLELAGGMVTGTALGEWVYNAGMCGRRVQAAVLCACASASTSAGSSGMAQYVASGKMAMASLGYRAPVQISDALPFMEALFGHLAGGCSFEKAACEARRAMPAETPDWALPLVFAREHKPPIVGGQPAAVARGSAIPSLLPPAPRSYFIAREAELGALRAALAQPGVQVLSAGEGGIGKTEIARVLAHEADRNGQLVLWVEKADLDPVRALVTMVQHAVPDFRAQADTTPESLRAVMCHALGGERGLLVLDDLASGSCVEQLRPSGSWSVLLTSRNAGLLPGVAAHRVPPLDLPTAQKLLARLVYEQDALPGELAEGATRLLEQLGGVPLLIETAAAQLRDGRDYGEVLADLQGGQGDVHAKATALLRQSLARLTDRDRFAWYVVAALPTAGARARNLAVALEESQAEADRRLRRLRDRSLVRWPAGAPRATMHPLARQVACELAQQAWEQVLEVAAKAVVDETTWCVAPLGSDGGEAFRRWSEVRAFMNTLALAQWPAGHVGADDIAEALSDAQSFRALELPPAEWAQLLEEAFARARAEQTLAHLHRARGDLRRFRDDLQGAEQDYERALHLFSSVQDNLGLAYVHMARGDLRVRRDDLLGAEQDYERALDLFSSVQSNLGLAYVHHARGNLRRFRDDLLGAEQDYERALDLFSSVQSNLGLAYVHYARGDLRRRRADLQGAEQDYERALDLFSSVQDNLGLAYVHYARGDLRVRRNDLQGAEQDYERALHLFSSARDNLGLANVHQARGDLRRRRGDLQGAVEAYLQAAPLYQTAQSNLGLSNTLVELAKVASLQDDRERTAELLEQAEPLVEASHNVYGRKRIAELRRWLAGER